MSESANEGTNRPPNILFFFPDQHRYDWMGLNPDVPIPTPNLDRLAKQGAYFTNSVCPSPLCAPARASLASGKIYERCRVPSNRVDYPLDQTTFYTMLRDQAGYHMMGCGKFDLHKASYTWGPDGKHLLQEWGFSDGIDNEGKYDGILSGAKEPKGPYMTYLHGQGLAETHVEDFRRRRGKQDATFTTPLPDEAYCDNWLANNGLDLLRAAPPDKPWFLQINFTGPHNPWDITASMEETCRGLDPLPGPVASDEFDAETHQRIRENYSAMVINIDRWVGIFLQELEAMGQLENTLIVYSSDHGEMLGDHKAWGKSVPYQPSIGVPLVISGLDVQSGQVVQTPTTIMDLTATFLDYAGLDRPEAMDSRSLRPLLRDDSALTRPVVTSSLGSWQVVFDGRYKLVRRRTESDVETSLFDLEHDPGEEMDLAAEQPDLIDALCTHLPTVEE